MNRQLIQQAERDALRLANQAESARKRGISQSTIDMLYRTPATLCWQAVRRLKTTMLERGE